MACSFPGCEKPIRNRTNRLCSTHYQRLWRHGDASVVKSRAARNPNPPCGSAHHRAKLTESDARLIIEAYESGINTRKLAEKFEVSQSTVAKVIRGDSWRHV